MKENYLLDIIIIVVVVGLISFHSDKKEKKKKQQQKTVFLLLSENLGLFQSSIARLIYKYMRLIRVHSYSRSCWTAELILCIPR